MQLYVADDYAAMSRYAARLMALHLRERPEAAVILPTGSSVQGFYRELVGLDRDGAFDPARLRIFQLDEYAGVAPDDPRSFIGWLHRTVLGPLSIPAAAVVRLRGEAADLDAACADYDRALAAAGGCDVAVLGLGLNGHVGFNEPPADPASPAHVVALSAQTRAANARYWGPGAPVPERALTCGMAAILGARRTLMLVSGAAKREILRRTLEGPPTPEVPASLLRRAAGVTVVADRAAWPWPQPAAVEGGRV